MRTAIILLILVLALLNELTVKSADKNEIAEYVTVIARDYGISPEFVMAVIQTESSWRADVTNGNCIGLMQVNPNCHKDRMERIATDYGFEGEDLTNPYFNVTVGIDYLCELFEEYEEPSYVLDVYNGNSKAKKNFEQGKISSYAKKVLDLAYEMELENADY